MQPYHGTTKVAASLMETLLSMSQQLKVKLTLSILSLLKFVKELHLIPMAMMKMNNQMVASSICLEMYALWQLSVYLYSWLGSSIRITKDNKK